MVTPTSLGTRKRNHNEDMGQQRTTHGYNISFLEGLNSYAGLDRCLEALKYKSLWNPNWWQRLSFFSMMHQMEGGGYQLSMAKCLACDASCHLLGVLVIHGICSNLTSMVRVIIGGTWCDRRNISCNGLLFLVQETLFVMHGTILCRCLRDIPSLH